MNTIFDPSLRDRQSLAVGLIESAIFKKQLAHAYLLVGHAQADKELIALETACFLNCAAEDKWQAGACAKAYFTHKKTDHLCQNCRWLVLRQHPQAWFSLDSDGNKSGKIPVEKARLLSEELSMTSQFWRIIIVPQSHEGAFHRPAANALLKTIEEPGSKSLFFLFAKSIEEVLPTLTSRCQVIPTFQSFALGLWPSVKKAKESKEQLSEGSEEEPPLSYELNLKLGSFLKNDQANTAEYIHFARDVKAFSEENESADEIIDFIAGAEIKRWGDIAKQSKSTSAYLSELLNLAETTKGQIDHYVTQKAVIEAFALSLKKLKGIHARDLKLGKTG